MQNIDKMSIEHFGIPSVVLMENAGSAFCDELLKRTNAKNFAVLCGKGNNGGDGSVVARHLFNKGKDVMLIILKDNLSGDALINFNIAKSIGVPIEIGITDTAKEYIKNCDVIVDALLGIGVKSEPYGDIKTAITLINGANKPVFSVDMPSGISADTGEIFGECVQADVTVTFGLYKIGLACYPARAMAGEVVVRDISFAPGAIESQNIKVNITDCIKLEKRMQDTHKGSFGKAFVLAGSAGFTGAAYLSSTAALKTGCGTVTLGIPKSLNPIMEQKLTEVMTLPLADNKGVLCAEALPEIDVAIKKSDVIICGCGLSNNSDISEIIAYILKNAKVPVVLDADGINALKGNLNLLKNANAVLTPHIGEMARLIDKDIQYVKNNTLTVAQSFAAEYNVVMVLKNAHTIIALPDGNTYINIFGNAGMATAGSGDVLTGIIGGLIGEGLPPSTAAVYGVHIHAKCGDAAAQEVGQRALTATDILNNITNLEKKYG